VKTASSSYHNHFKEPLRFSLKKKKKRFRYPLRVSNFGKKNSQWFSVLPVLIKIMSPGFQQQFSEAGFQNSKKS
jgi:hypothetical protein